MKKALLLATFLLLSLSAMATAQIPDYIIYKGEKYAMHTNPLEQYFEQFPDKRPEGLQSTALWRGYIATFEIIDDQLCVKDIEVEHYDNETQEYSTLSVLNDIFPDEASRRLDWWSGLMVLPHGEIVQYVHMGYASVYSEYLLLQIESGKLTDSRKFDHEEYEKFKERQFEAFKITDEYVKMKEELSRSRNYPEEFLEEFLRIFVIDYSSKIMDD